MQGWLLYSQKDAEQNRSYIDWFIDEAQKEDIELRLIVREQLDVGIETGAYCGGMKEMLLRYRLLLSYVRLSHFYNVYSRMLAC